MTVTIIEGDISGTSADRDVWTLGGYGVYRSPSANMGASSKVEFEFTLLDDLDFLSVAYLF